eukprot:TRINITY_DN34658_c0_g1_i1.p2 TRINITY_DN34658_c0_g1~~TRINITY_DN34658_c0_g1_i1.p2  ORF type:complete len:124 (+),score=43.95 TRINITY_DN34658_c0_g1_i1:55-426(+)
MLTFDSGVFSLFFFFKQKTAYEMLRSLVGSEMCIRDRIMGQPLDFAPGTNTQYSNTGFLILGMVVEAVSGMPLEAAFQSLVFEPAAVSRTDWGVGETFPSDHDAREWVYDSKGEHLVLSLIHI